MLGAIAGDVIGSVFEWERIKTTDFPLFSPRSDFTDDTVMTIAAAYGILHGVDYANAFKDFGRRYPGRGYGGFFMFWLNSPDNAPYNSWGNGSAMRVSPVGFAFDTVADVLAEANKSAEVTHNHPEGVKGAQATALAIYLARTGCSKEDIRNEIRDRFGYDLDQKLDDIRPVYQFDESCQGTVPQAIVAFLESEDVEDAIRKAVSLGGDSDTLACITGGIAHAFYKHIPVEIVRNVRDRLPEEFVQIMDEFRTRYLPDEDWGLRE
ncbi:MAG: ADP-ribosylglycohydrolase family protein [Anaerolineaceae bacterium]|nr:ADP-ribosylglycohydrolase family protein [Anaerolineaceae bacterium]